MHAKAKNSSQMKCAFSALPVPPKPSYAQEPQIPIQQISKKLRFCLPNKLAGDGYPCWESGYPHCRL